MFLADVVGTVVSPFQIPILEGEKLLLLRPVTPAGAPTAKTRIGIDRAGAGVGDRVLVLDEGTGARQILGDPKGAVKTVVVGVVDYVELGGEQDHSEPVPFVQMPEVQFLARFSPDGEFVAYLSKESGRSELYVDISDCEVVPVAQYELRATGDGVMFSDPVSLTTIDQPGTKFWGDVAGMYSFGFWNGPDGTVNIGDAQAALPVAAAAAASQREAVRRGGPRAGSSPVPHAAGHRLANLRPAPAVQPLRAVWRLRLRERLQVVHAGHADPGRRGHRALPGQGALHGDQDPGR